MKETKILCWNVNGIRAAERDGFLEWLYRESPDILCVQETKANPGQLDEDMRGPRGYHVYWNYPERKGYRAIIRKNLGEKSIKMIYARGDSKILTRNVEVPKAERRRFCITDDDVLTLADYAIKIEGHYSNQLGEAQPMDIEWAKDGDTGHLFIVQARPETVQSRRVTNVDKTQLMYY